MGYGMLVSCYIPSPIVMAFYGFKDVIIRPFFRSTMAKKGLSGIDKKIEMNISHDKNMQLGRIRSNITRASQFHFGYFS